MTGILKAINDYRERLNAACAQQMLHDPAVWEKLNDAEMDPVVSMFDINKHPRVNELKTMYQSDGVDWATELQRYLTREAIQLHYAWESVTKILNPTAPMTPPATDSTAILKQIAHSNRMPTPNWEKIKPWKGENDKRSAREYYEEVELFFCHDCRAEMADPETKKDIAAFVKNHLEIGNGMIALSRRWADWATAKIADGVAEPWPSKEELVSWLDLSVTVRRTVIELYQAYIQLNQNAPGLLGYNGYRLEFENISNRLKQADVKMTFKTTTVEVDHQLMIMQFIRGLHSTVKKILGPVIQPSFFKKLTIEEMISKVSERAVSKLRDEGATETEKKPYARTYTSEAGKRPYAKAWTSSGGYPKQARVAYAAEQEYEEEQETWDYEGVWEEHQEDETMQNADEEEGQYDQGETYAEEGMVAYAEGYKGGGKKGGAGKGYKGSKGSGKGYKGGKGKGGKGHSAGKGKDTPMSEQVKTDEKRCKVCSSPNHQEAKNCYWSKDFDEKANGPRPTWADFEDKVQLASTRAKNALKAAY